MYGKYFPSEKVHLDHQTITNSCSQIELWAWFLGHRVHLGQPICNPMRSDNHPNCWLSWGIVKKDFIVLNDFAHPNPFHGFTIFDALMYRYSINFDQACVKIYEEFMKPAKIRLQANPNVAFEAKPDDFNFVLSYIPWTLNGREIFVKEDKQYWEQYEITSQQLKSDNVKSNRRILFNSRTNPSSFTALDVTPSYTYLFKKHKKCYQPYHNRHKWLSTCTEEDVGGWDTIRSDDNLIITKSYKDWRVLKNSGYNSIWLQNEGCKIPWDKLVKLNEIKTKFILFDNDNSGKNAAKNLADYANQFDDSYIPIWYDEHLPKDSADIVKKFSSRILEQELANMGIQ